MKTSDTNLLKLAGWNIQGDIGGLTCYTSRKRGVVVFIKAPPRVPPSFAQIHQRNRFRAAGQAWQSMGHTEREKWRTLCNRLKLRIGPPALFFYWYLKTAHQHIRTIEHQAATKVLDFNP